MTDERGLTLVEVLVASFIFLVVILAAYNVIDSSARIARTQSEIADMDAGGRIAIDMMATEIREAGYNPNRLDLSQMDPANAAWVTVPNFTFLGEGIEIRMDVNGDGDTLDENEYVRYEWQNPAVNNLSTLIRSIDTDADGTLDEDQVLVENVMKTNAADIFTFLNASGSPITTSVADIEDDTRAVLIQFTVQSVKPDRVTRNYNHAALQQVIRLRNAGRFPR